MPLANPYQQYRQTSVQTADRGQILVMTYEAIVRWLGRADDAIDGNRIPDAHEALINCQELVRNLSWSLDFERGGQIATNLSALYDYISEQLAQANVQKSKEITASVRALILPLLETWREAVALARKEGQLAPA